MRTKAKPIFAFAIKTRGELSTADIEPFTDEGRSDLLRRINRPAGQSVIKVRINEVQEPKR